MLGGQAARQGVEGPEGGLEGGLQGGLEGKHWVESLKGDVDPLVPRGDLNDRWSVVLALRPKMMITIVNTAPPPSSRPVVRFSHAIWSRPRHHPVQLRILYYTAKCTITLQTCLIQSIGPTNWSTVVQSVVQQWFPQIIIVQRWCMHINIDSKAVIYSADETSTSWCHTLLPTYHTFNFCCIANHSTVMAIHHAWYPDVTCESVKACKHHIHTHS